MDPLCDWLREAQVDVRLTGRQHASVESSQQMAPAGVRGCLSVMHEVTRRIMEAVESARVMASKVAEGLEGRIVGAVAPVLRPRVNLLQHS